MDECRKEFEKWARESGLEFNQSPDVHDGFVYRAWKAYQAAWNTRAPVAQLTDEEISRLIVNFGIMADAWPSQEILTAFARAIAARVQSAAGQQSDAAVYITDCVYNCPSKGGYSISGKVDVFVPAGTRFYLEQPPAANAAQDVRNQALEDAAAVCESRKPASREEFPEHWKAYEKVWGMREFFADECAMAIRALKTPAKREG